MGFILTAFVAGIVSFLSPCVLPLVPGYLSMISGVSIEQLKESNDPRIARSVLGNSLMFILGFSITFILLGLTATWLGAILSSEKRLLSQIGGLVIIVFGLHLTGILKIPFLYQDKRFHNVSSPRGVWGSMLLGLAFGFGWAPCVGPVLAGILAMAASRETVWQGGFLLAVFSLGLGVPFLLTSLGLNRFLAFYGRFKRHFHAVEVASGVLVITIGVLILTDKLIGFNSYFAFLNRFAL